MQTYTSTHRKALMCLYTHRHTSAHGHIHGLRTRTRSDTHKHVSVRTNTCSHGHTQIQTTTPRYAHMQADRRRHNTVRDTQVCTRGRMFTQGNLYFFHFLPPPSPAPFRRADTLGPFFHIYALVREPSEHSLSPRQHQRGGRAGQVQRLCS